MLFLLGKTANAFSITAPSLDRKTLSSVIPDHCLGHISAVHVVVGITPGHSRCADHSSRQSNTPRGEESDSYCGSRYHVEASADVAFKEKVVSAVEDLIPRSHQACSSGELRCGPHS